MRRNVINSLLNRCNFLGLFVRNFGFELVFECHYELDHIERIGTEVVKERRFVFDLGVVDAKLFSDDLLDALFDAFHADLQIRSEEHTSELQSLMRISYAVFCLKTKSSIKT